MFKPSSLSLISGYALNAIKVALFLRNDDITNIDWVLEYWNGDNILSVERWTEEGGKWALHIDLTALKKPGQELFIPFDWWWGDKPTVLEAIKAYRSQMTEESVSRFLKQVRMNR